MAQATYTDDTQAAIRQKLAQTKAASQATVARAAPRPAISVADVDPNTLSASERGAFARQGYNAPIDPINVQSRAAQLGNQAGAANVVGSDVPAAARRGIAAAPSVSEIGPESLSPAERAGFVRQGYTPPAPAAIAPATPITSAASATPEVRPGFASRAASGIAGGVGRAVGGLVEAPFSPAGLAIQTGASAVNSFNRPTEDYYRRFGADPNNTSALGDVAARTGGVVTDLGASIGDLGIGGANLIRGAAGAPPLQSFSSIIQARDNPAAAQRSRIDEAAQGGANTTALPPSNADFSGVNAPNPSNPTANDPRSTALTPDLSAGIAALPNARSNAGRDLGYGKTINGVRTFSDGSGGAGAPPRTISDTGIAGLANGNRLSVADAGIGGNIASEAAGRTLNFGEGPTNAGQPKGFTADDRQAQLNSFDRRDSQAQFDRLMKKSEIELARGNKKTSGILAGLAGQYKQAPQTDPNQDEQSLTRAKASEAEASAAETRSQTGRRNKTTQLIEQAQRETDPQKKQGIYDTILASEGKDSGRVITLKVRDPSGAVDALGNPVVNELPFDTRTKQFLYTPQASQSIAR